MAYTASQSVRGPDGLHPAYAAFGDKAASAILAGVSKFPPKARSANLKVALNTIDPSLWSRTKKLSERYRAQGVPQAQALHQGLSRAMSTGLVAEVVRLGTKAGKQPPKKGIVGLAAYGFSGIPAFAGLGAIFDVTGVVAKGVTPPTLQEGSCDSTGAFIYKGGTWVRKSATDVCTNKLGYTGGTGTGGGGVTVTETAAGVGDGKGPITVRSQLPGDDASGTVPGALLQAGPFSIPLGARAFTIHVTSSGLPAEWSTFITQELAHDCSNCLFTSMEDSTPGHPLGVLRDFFGDATPPKSNKDLVKISTAFYNTVTKRWEIVLALPDQPIVLVERPDTHEVWGLFMVIAPRDPSYAWDSTTNPYEMSIVWKKNPTGVWDWIKKIIGAIVNAIGDALSAVGDLACSLLGSSMGQAGAVVGGAVIGGTTAGPKGAQTGAQVGAAGAAIANKQCAPTATGPIVAPQSSWLVPAALIGGGALLILALNKKKKATTP